MSDSPYASFKYLISTPKKEENIIKTNEEYIFIGKFIFFFYCHFPFYTAVIFFIKLQKPFKYKRRVFAICYNMFFSSIAFSIKSYTSNVCSELPPCFRTDKVLLFTSSSPITTV